MTKRFFITRDDNERGDHVIWPDGAVLSMETDGTWWDERCRYRGDIIGADIVDIMLGAFLLKGKIVTVYVTAEIGAGDVRT